jgi:ParB family chromosome partitioning protein
MTKKKPASIPESGSAIFIPLGMLKKSPRNARKTPHTKAEIEALAASIASHGMIQNPVVEPEQDTKDKATGYYLVTAGEGRRLAQLLRAKRKEIAKNEPIRCLVDTAHNAFEISVAENAIRSDMHPADQFEAFFKLHTDHGMNAEDIAARFGVTAAVVRQRLKLAAISPALIQAYRRGDMNLDQLTAFAITDDHAKQEAVWMELPDFNNDRDAILDALNEDHVSAHDRRAVFVGVQAYEAAGGTIIRDLFAEEGGGYFADPALLNRLAQEKLQGIAEGVKAEGWKWIETPPEFDHGFTADMRRIYPAARALSESEQEQVDALEAEYEALTDDDSEETTAEAERIELAIAAITGEDVYDAALTARAGAIATLDASGEPRIERGFIRREDDDRKGAKKQADPQAGGTPPLPEKLIAELTAYRSLGLRHALALQPDTALIAVIHALAASLFYPYAGSVSCLEITPRSHALTGHAPALAEHPSTQALDAAHEEWAARLPEDAGGLWDCLVALDHESRLRLLAHCAALTVNAVRAPSHASEAQSQHSDALARAVNLDMHAHWSPTSAAYLGRVTKERILEAVREGVSKESADNIASLKKGAMAEAAEQRLAQSGWLPPLLRSQAAPPLAIAAE